MKLIIILMCSSIILAISFLMYACIRIASINSRKDERYYDSLDK